jgi:hypothetical protein
MQFYCEISAKIFCNPLKTIKKALIVVALLLIGRSHCFAQDDGLVNQLSGSAGAATMTTLNYSGHYNTGYGINVGFFAVTNKTGQASLNAGYFYFTGKKPDTVKALSVASVMLGYRYFFSGAFYCEGRAGLDVMHTTGVKAPSSATNASGMLVIGVDKQDYGLSVFYYANNNSVGYLGITITFSFSSRFDSERQE